MTKQDLPFQEGKSEQDLMAFIQINKNRGVRLVNLPVSVPHVISFIQFQGNIKL